MCRKAWRFESSSGHQFKSVTNLFSYAFFFYIPMFSTRDRALCNPDLDEGPIIEQESERVNHSMSADRLNVAAGRDIELRVLARAVKVHLEYASASGNKTSFSHSQGRSRDKYLLRPCAAQAGI